MDTTADAQALVDKLRAREPLELAKPVRLYDDALADGIASLRLHPAVEGGLHLLNGDLESAHFLIRKCQGRAITDYWHGILHRIENDFRNSRLWYKVMDLALVQRFHKDVETAQQFVWDCQNVVVDHNDRGLDVEGLKRKAMAEMYGLLDIAIEEFGLEARADVSDYYSAREGDKELKGKMTSGVVRREGHENE